MFNIYKLFFYDPEPEYGGWFSLDEKFFAVDSISALMHAKETGWGPSIKMVEW